MNRFLMIMTTVVSLFLNSCLSAHCQMPCGIYHDEMVFDQIDQYVETMYKAMAMLNNSAFTSVKERNEFVRWVVQKENESNKIAELLTTYFLQQKIKPDESDTAKRLASVHKLLFGLVVIKQNVDKKFVDEFSKQWDTFKLMFHREGYKCEVEKLKLKKFEEEHSHDHDHDHEH